MFRPFAAFLDAVERGLGMGKPSSTARTYSHRHILVALLTRRACVASTIGHLERFE